MDEELVEAVTQRMVREEYGGTLTEREVNILRNGVRAGLIAAHTVMTERGMLDASRFYAAGKGTDAELLPAENAMFAQGGGTRPLRAIPPEVQDAQPARMSGGAS